MTFKEFYDKGEEWFLTLVDKHVKGRRDDNLKELITGVYDFCNSDADPEKTLKLYEKYYGEDARRTLFREYKDYLDKRLNHLKNIPDECAETFSELDLKKGVEFSLELGDALRRLINAKDLDAYKEKLEFSRWSFGKLPEDLEDLKEILVDSRDDLKELVQKVNTAIEEASLVIDESAKKHTADFITVLNRFGDIYRAEKTEENALDFNDLEHYALKVLENQDIRQEIKSKYKFISVDEYQDTNGVQEEILNKIDDDNILVVGDVKQSIYGFRGCRPEFFIQKQKAMENPDDKGKVVRLNENFRSAKNVVNAVNEIFDFCMTKETFGEDYKGNHDLVFGGGYPEGKDGRAEFHYIKKEKSTKKEEEAKVYDVIERVKDGKDDKDSPVAALVADIINQELKNTYYNPKEKKDLPIELGDIAILTRSRENEYVKNIVRGLNARGISVTSDVKENVCDFPEIKMLIAALEVTDCFSRDIPLATVLKSPVGGFNDSDLLDIADYYRENTSDDRSGFYVAFNYYLNNAKTTLASRLKEFTDYFSSVRFLADFIGAEGVLNKLVKDKDLEAYLLATDGGKTRLNRLKRFIAASRSGDNKLTVGEFLNKIETSDDAFNFADGGSSNAVKLMTIHKSKGLEFPVVIVCGLECNFNADDQTAEVIKSREKGLAFKYYQEKDRLIYNTILRSVAAEQIREQSVQEEMRLFYVATTRATYSLHMTYWAAIDRRTKKYSGAKKFINFMPKSMPVTVHYGSGSLVSKPSVKRSVIVGKGDEEREKQFRENFNYLYPYLEETTLPLKSNVTAVTKDFTDQDELTYVLFDEGCTDIERGNIAHKILEHFDFSRIGEYKTQVQSMIDGGVISREDSDKIDHQRIESALSSGAFKGVGDYDLYREKSFVTSIEANLITSAKTDETVLLQGVIDLLGIDKNDAVIIDYKYSALTKDGLKKKYAKQLELYAYAVEKLLGKTVSKKTIVNLYTGETVEV